MTAPTNDDQTQTSQQPKRRISPLRRLVAILVLVGAVAATAAYKYDQAHRPRIIAGPMIQMPAPDSLRVVWIADAPFAQGSAKLVGAHGEISGARVEPKDGRYVAKFDKLQRGEVYEYSIANRGFLSDHAVTSGPHMVRITPSRDATIRFLAFGDSGIGSNTQAKLAKRMVAQRPDVVIHTGDLIYPAGAEKDYVPNFYRPYHDLIASAIFMPSLGNHDVATQKGAPFLHQFILPENGPRDIEPERNYWFDYGPVRFVALDTNLDAGGGAITHQQMKTTIADWLRKTMTECDAKWRVVYFHQPFYTGSAHSAESSAYVKEAYLDVFDETGVDLVLCGHNHLYERTAPMRHDKIVSPGEGIIYVTTGAGGAQRYPEGETPPDYIVKSEDAQFSFSSIDASPTTLKFRQLGQSGTPIDEFTLTK